MKKLATVFVICLLAGFSAASAKSDYLTTILSRYNIPAGSKLNSCSTCHTGVPSPRNIYGVALSNANISGNELNAFALTDTMDTDHDGATNEAELRNGTWPWDPNDTTPVDESTWGRIKALFN